MDPEQDTSSQERMTRDLETHFDIPWMNRVVKEQGYTDRGEGGERARRVFNKPPYKVYTKESGGKVITLNIPENPDKGLGDWVKLMADKVNKNRPTVLAEVRIEPDELNKDSQGKRYVLVEVNGNKRWAEQPLKPDFKLAAGRSYGSLVPKEKALFISDNQLPAIVFSEDTPVSE